MSPKEHMDRFARRVPGGGIAWENALFSELSPDEARRLVDAAVDIAWERLMPHTRTRNVDLAINRQGRLLVFRLEGPRRDPELPFQA